MATRPDEQIVICRRGRGEPSTIQRTLKRNAPDEQGSSGAQSSKRRAVGPPADHSAATILPASHLYIEKLGELRSPVLP